MLTKIAKSDTSLSTRNLLFLVGAAAALLAAVVFRKNLSAEYFLLRMIGIIPSGPEGLPATASDWFSVLQDSRFLGLVLLNFFDVFNYLLYGVMLIALFAALRKYGEAMMFVAAALGFVGIAVFLSSNQALSVLAIFDKYVYAATEAQRQHFLSGAEGVLAVNFRESFSGTGIYSSFFCVSLSGLLIAVVMRRSRLFGRAAAVTGILANTVGLGYYPVLLIVPGLVPLILSVSAVLLLIWYILIAVRLFNAGRAPLAVAKMKRRTGSRGRRR